MTDMTPEQALSDALDNLVHDNYERSYRGSQERQADADLIRNALSRPAVPQPRLPDDGAGDEDAYNAGWNACREAMLAAAPQAPAVPEGWKPVPVEPTSHQLHAAYDDHMMHLNYKQSTCHELAADIYRAMLAAAPAEESSGDHFRDATKMVEGEERTTPEDALVWNGSALSAVRSESGLMRHLSKCAARVAQWPDWKRKAMESAEGDSE